MVDQIDIAMGILADMRKDKLSLNELKASVKALENGGDEKLKNGINAIIKLRVNKAFMRKGDVEAEEAALSKIIELKDHIQSGKIEPKEIGELGELLETLDDAADHLDRGNHEEALRIGREILKNSDRRQPTREHHEFGQLLMYHGKQVHEQGNKALGERMTSHAREHMKGHII